MNIYKILNEGFERAFLDEGNPDTKSKIETDRLSKEMKDFDINGDGSNEPEVEDPIIDENEQHIKLTVVEDMPQNWAPPMSKFQGRISGLVCGFNMEFEFDDGRIDYSSCQWTNAFEYAVYNKKDYWKCNDFGRMMDLVYMTRNGKCKPTGNIIFRGYYLAHYDWDGNDYEEVKVVNGKVVEE